MAKRGVDGLIFVEFCLFCIARFIGLSTLQLRIIDEFMSAEAVGCTLRFQSIRDLRCMVAVRQQR
jgi:hypothetical protein